MSGDYPVERLCLSVIGTLPRMSGDYPQQVEKAGLALESTPRERGLSRYLPAQAWALLVLPAHAEIF